MKRSEKIIEKNGIQQGLSWDRQKVIENNVLLKHIIDNDLSHMWRWIQGIVLLLVGLIAKSFFFGG